MKNLRDVPLRYRVAALGCGGISLFLFGVVFALLRQADRIAPSPAWDWVLAALIALIAAVGALFGLLAWGALSDPKSRLGSRFREKSADAAQTALGLLCGEVFAWGGVFLSLLAGSYSIYLGVAAFLCWVLLVVLFFRRGLKRDIEALDDPNDNPRSNRLIGKSRERGSCHYRDSAGRLGHDRGVGDSGQCRLLALLRHTNFAMRGPFSGVPPNAFAQTESF